MKNRPLSEEYYKSKCKLYSRAYITLLIVGIISLVLDTILTCLNITLKVLGGDGGSSDPTLALGALILSAIYYVRLDALKENYELHKKLSEPGN